MNEILKLSPRLARAADFVREGSFVADVGTDHAYLPIYLCLSDRACGAVASDINEGPVMRARENINKYSLDKKIDVLRTDGLCGIEKYAPDDVLILGMGGELIAKIISDAPWTKRTGLRLCLQPMTHPEILRGFLLQNGYSILDEALAEEEKIYQIILAEYTGRTAEYTDAELLLGRHNAGRGGEVFARLCERQIQILVKRAEGKESAGERADEERGLIKKIAAMASKENV